MVEKDVSTMAECRLLAVPASHQAAAAGFVAKTRVNVIPIRGEVAWFARDLDATAPVQW